MRAPQTTYAVPQIEISKTVLDRDRRDVVSFDVVSDDVFMFFFAKDVFDHTRVNFATAQDKKNTFCTFFIKCLDE